MIALLCPTRGRPEQFKRMCDSAQATATNRIEMMSGSNGGDTYADKQFPQDIPTVYMWNWLAKECQKQQSIKLFMLASDDMIFSTPCWDEALITHYNSLVNKVHVYHLQDSRDPQGTPHPIVTREYIEAMGYFLPPLFLHWYVDTWTREIAKANNCFTHLKDYLLIHDKPNDNGKADNTHKHIRYMGWLSRDHEVDRSCQHLIEFEKQRLARAFV